MIALGAMSGTSTDGVDIAAIQIDPKTQEMRFLGATSAEFSQALRDTLLRLQEIPPKFSASTDPISILLQARKDLTELYASTVNELLSFLGLEPADVRVVGAHGQTLRHRPDLGLALGGQGAPLVPAFHQAWLNGRGIYNHTAVLNLGGFSNLSVLNGQEQPLTGGDCGPANCLMDLWAQRAFGLPMDQDGEIAAAGRPNIALLDRFWTHPFFRQSWPKSTGRDDFSAEWFDRCLVDSDHLSSEDIMATLLALSVRAVKSCLPVLVEQVYVCGGGAKNTALVNQLRCECAPTDFLPIENLGLPAQAVEAAAFAWLAGQYLQTAAGNCPSVTGASRTAVLGALHSAS